MYACIDCGYLDKSRKNVSTKTDYFQYGCNQRGSDKFICGWCKNDKDLKNSFLGCSDWKPIKQDDKFLKGLAKNYEVLVCGERNGKHITYQYNEEKFLKEFNNNNFSNSNYDGDIVEHFYYKGEHITNFKIFPETYGTDSETMYDVVCYILKKQYLESLNSKKNDIQNVIPNKQFIEKNQIAGQMSIMDFIN